MRLVFQKRDVIRNQCRAKDLTKRGNNVFCYYDVIDIRAGRKIGRVAGVPAS
jgi:hypothetical protein